MVRFILRVGLVLGGIVLVAAVAAGIAVTWARAGVRAQRTPLPSTDEVAKAAPTGELPTRISWINTASQFVPRAALIDQAGDPDAGAWSRMSFPAFVIGNSAFWKASLGEAFSPEIPKICKSYLELLACYLIFIGALGLSITLARRKEPA